ncbi:MAG: hypothetical protein H6831_05545 [Planctomycetes bacterium]|nr:hypothetical protein [Planctomycetota bacterium]MCB9903853.1 hypothetical protein [Planctomycetota bacterium]
MTILVRSLGLLLAPALLSVSIGDFSFAPAEESEIKVEFKQIFNVELTDMSLAFNGEDVDTSEMGVPEFTLRDEELMQFTDVFVKAGDERPAVVHRTYDELTKMSMQSATSPEGDEETNEDPGTSELEGVTLAFTWDADDEGYVASYLEEEGDTDLLEDLEFGGYLVDFLPDGEVEEGDRWQVDASCFDKITEPCGDVSFVLESKKDDEDDDDTWGEQFSDNLDGEFFVEYGGMRDEDGTQVAVFTLTAEISTEIVQEQEIDEEMFSGSTTSTFSFDFDMEGELLWNVEAKRPFSLTFNGDVEFQIEEDTELSGDHGEMKQTTVQMFEGTVEVSSSYN